PARVAGEVRGFEPERYMERKDLKKMDIFIQYALAAAQMAVEDAGLPSPVPVPERTGVIVGVGMGGIASLEEAYLLFAAGNLRRVSPFFIPKLIPNMASGHIALRIAPPARTQRTRAPDLRGPPSTRVRAGRGSTPRWSAMAPTATPTT